MKKVHELNSIFDSRKSFYGKAIVTIDCVQYSNDIYLSAQGEKHLYSYGTHVAYIDAANLVHLLPFWNYSATTLRHVKEFLKQNGYKADSSAQMRLDYLS